MYAYVYCNTVSCLYKTFAMTLLEQVIISFCMLAHGYLSLSGGQGSLQSRLRDGQMSTSCTPGQAARLPPSPPLC